MTETNSADAAEPQEPVTEPAPEAEAAVETEAQPDFAQELAERTADLQRLQAEYVNYKRRVDRDREAARTAGKEDVLRSLLDVLDDLDRAAEHGELTGGFKAVADELQTVVSKYQLEKFGESGDAFDPALHEAVFHAGESSDVQVTSIAQVMRTGYKVADRVLRHATVGVVDPIETAPVTESPTVDDSVQPDEAESSDNAEPGAVDDENAIETDQS